LGLQDADEANAVSFRVAMGQHVDAVQRVCVGLGQNEIVMVGKNPGPF